MRGFIRCTSMEWVDAFFADVEAVRAAERPKPKQSGKARTENRKAAKRLEAMGAR